MLNSTIKTFLNNSNHLGRTNMDVKSVDVRNAQNSHVTRSVLMASSKIMKVALSANVEVDYFFLTLFYIKR